ncbi:MAG: CAP domain-containing protein, partial [Chloroflexota bacterium]
FNNDDPATAQLGEVITQSIDKAGTIFTITSPDLSVRTSTYESSTRHNIANVFAYYGNQQGLIWNGSSYVNGLLFYPNATYVFGLPITEPYWIRAVVGGVEKDVLVQLFERRVLTYTPSNDLNNRAEMGNVGQHYYRWRYQESLGRGTNNPITATPTNTPPVSNTPIPTLGSTTTPTNTPVPSTTPIVTATSTPTPTPIATSTVAPTVTPTPSDPLPSQWLARFNAYRAAAGLPPVTEDAALSAADAKHVDYMLLNPNEMVHDEDPTHPGYSPEGQQAAKQSNLARGGSNNDPIDMWMSDILHRYGMLKPELISTGYSFKCNAQGCGAALNVIAKTTGTGLPDGVVYPGNGQQSVANLQYITWQFGSFDPVVTLVSASLKDGQGQAVPFTAQPAQGYFNVVALQLQNSLTASTTYTVQFTVSQNGQTKNKTWSFKTL